MNLYPWVQPGAVAAKQDLVRAGALHGLNDVIVVSNRRRISIEIGEANKLVDGLLVRLPVAGKAAKMGNDEVDVRILGSKHFGDVSTPAHVHQDGESKRARHVADLTRGHGLKPVYLDAAEPPARDRMLGDGVHLTRLAQGVNEGEADQPAGMAGDDPRQLLVGLDVIRVESREDDSLVDAGRTRASQIQA